MTLVPEQALLRRKLREDQDGGVTVDWVVLTAAIVLFGSIVVAIISPGVVENASSIYTSLSSTGI